MLPQMRAICCVWRESLNRFDFLILYSVRPQEDTSKGVVKGKKAGKAKITVSANGVNKTFKVTVNK